MAGTNILVRQKDLIAGSGISITPDTTSGNVTIAATNTAIDEARLLPTGGKNGNILEYQEGADRGNGNDVRLLLQNAMTDSANGNAAPAAVTTQGVTLTGDNNLLFDGNDSHVSAVLATDEIFAADKEWTIDFWMKPTANSSEWNYILTENRGDWGSHSIGLTWNKTKNVLEQDTGGYLASVIRSSNWPNDSVACAASEWHFVAVEKQKTASGWNLNYYLNGAIWLQVAFTGEFVPFTSDNPFWFGGKTTDSGRWFKGEANKLRVTAGARYGGKAFAVPDRLIDYAAPAGQPVWIEGIDRSRLLPENPASGDIPCYNATATTGGGNDVNTKVLLHFDELPFFDIAAGNASPAAVTNSGITLDTENFRFGTASAKFANSSNNLKVTVPKALMMSSPWLADCWFKVDDGQWNEYCRIFTQDDEQNGGWNYYLTSGNRVGVWVRNVTPNEPASAALTPGDWHYAALVYYNAKFYGFVDGVRFTVQDGSTEGFLNYIMLGKRIQSTSYSLRGNIDEFRLQLLDESEISKWIGATIPVPAAPYSKPQTVGEWGKLNKNELVQSVNGVAPDESGNIMLDASTIIDESRLLPETGSVSSDSAGNPVIFKAVSRIDNTYWLCLPLSEDTNDRSTYDVTTGVYGTVNIVSNAPSSPGGSAFFNGSSCLHGTLPAQFGASDFTVRLWMMAPTISSSSHTIFSTRRGNQTDADTFGLLCTTEGRLFIYSNGDITSRTDTPFTLQSNVWYHVAVVRKSGVLTIYVNGEVYNSAAFTNSLTRQIFGLGASWTGSSYSEAGTVYLTSLDVLNYAAYDGAFTTPAYQPGILAGMGYAVATDSEVTDMLSAAGIDESRLLPKVDSIPTSQSGHALVYDYQSGIDADTLCLLHLDDSTWADATGKNTITQHGNVAKVSDSGYFNKALDLSGNQSSGSLSWLTVPWLAEYEAATWTMEFFAKPTKSVVNFMFFSFGNSQGSYLSLGSQSLTNLWLGNGSGTYTGNFNFSLNTWYWFVVQYDGSAVKVYVDGQLVVQGNFTPNYVGQDLQFGNLNLVNNQDNTFIGYLDEFRWSKGLRYPTGVMEIPTQPFGSSQARFKVAAKGFVPSDSRQLLPNNPSDYDLAIYRVFPEEAAPQNLTSATSDSNWEVTWSGAYSGRVGWQAFDSDQRTTWCTYSAAVGDWLCWEYKGTEGSVLLRRYSIAKGSGNGDCPTGWKIQGSNDGSTWVDLDEQTGQNFPDNNAKEYTIPNNSTPYKFHRFYLLSWNTSNMIGTFKAWSWINSTEEREVWLPINKSEFVVNDARLLPDAPSDTTNSYWLNSGPVATQVSPASYAGSTDATWTMELSGTFEGGDIATLFDSDTTNGVSGTLGLETFGTVRWIRKDQVPYRIDQIVLRAQTSDIGAFPQTIYLSGYDKSTFSTEIVQEFNAPVWETESNTSTAATSFTRVCTLDVNAPAFQSYDYSIALGSGAGMETTLQAFAAYQIDTDIAWKQLNTATTTTAGLMAAADKVKLDALQQAATYINIATDFDTYKTAGSYFLKGAVHTNGPLTDSYAGTLVVVAPAELRYTTQYFTQLYTNKTFVRTYSRENSAWSAWNRVIVDTDLATTTVAGLMSATDREKSIGLTTRGLYPNARAKSGAVDFNEVIDHGFYFIGGDTPHLNYPETNKQTGGTLQVIRNGNYLTQTLILFDKNKSFNRSCFNANSGSSERTFSAWRRALTAPDITESKARPGYFKLPGGTIVQWGKKTAITRDEENCYISFPIAFPTMFLSATAIASSGTLSATGVIVSLSEASTTSMTMVVKNHPNTGSPDMDQYIEMYWFAVGF